MNKRDFIKASLAAIGLTAIGATVVEASPRTGRPIMQVDPVGTSLVILDKPYVTTMITDTNAMTVPVQVWLGHGPGGEYANKGCPLVAHGAKSVLVSLMIEGGDGRYYFYKKPEFKPQYSVIQPPGFPDKLIMQLVIPIDQGGKTWLEIEHANKVSSGVTIMQIAGYHI